MPAHVLPPAADRLDCEGRGIGAGPDVHPAGVRGQVIHPVRGDLAQLLAGEVVVVDPLRLTRPLGARVGVVADQLLLLGIDRDDRLPGVDWVNQFVYTQPNGTPTGVFVANNGTHVYSNLGGVHGDLYAPVKRADYRRA